MDSFPRFASRPGFYFELRSFAKAITTSRFRSSRLGLYRPHNYLIVQALLERSVFLLLIQEYYVCDTVDSAWR
jgi:hypothetical protein